jgi:hypothetical protein
MAGGAAAIGYPNPWFRWRLTYLVCPTSLASFIACKVGGGDIPAQFPVIEVNADRQSLLE